MRRAHQVVERRALLERHELVEEPEVHHQDQEQPLPLVDEPEQVAQHEQVPQVHRDARSPRVQSQRKGGGSRRRSACFTDKFHG